MVPSIALLVLAIALLALLYSAARGVLLAFKRVRRPRPVPRTKAVRFNAPLPPPLTEAEKRHEEAAEAVRQVREDMARRQTAEANRVVFAVQPPVPKVHSGETPTEKGLRLAAESTERQQRSTANLRAAEKALAAPPELTPERKTVVVSLPDGGWEAKLIGAPPVLLRYRDASGAVTNRVVLPQGVRCGPAAAGGHEVKALTGFCMLRKTRRQFLAARMDNIADPETGELVNIEALVVAHVERA